MIAKSNYLGYILVCLLITSAAFLFTPIISNGLLVLIIGMLLAALIILNVGKKYYQRQSPLLLYTFLYLFLCIIYKLVGISSASIGAIVVHIIFFVFLLLMVCLPYKLTIKQTKIIVYAVVLIVLFDVVDNIRICILYPEIAAVVNRGNVELDTNLNIGGTRFYNAVFFFFTICFFGYLNSDNKKLKRVMLISVVTSGIFIFAFCLKASVLVFSCLSLFLLYYAKKAKSVSAFSFRILIPALFVFVVLNVFSDAIIELLSQLFSSERLVARLSFMIDSESSERGASTVEARENLWMLSFNTWTDSFTNFLFGIGDHRASFSEGETAEETGIGQHSDFFDSLARYGLLGAFILFNVLYYGFKYLLSLFGKRYKLQLLVIILIFFLFSVTKGVFRADIGFVLFAFLPLLAKLLNRGDKYIA